MSEKCPVLSAPFQMGQVPSGGPAPPAPGQVGAGPIAKTYNPRSAFKLTCPIFKWGRLGQVVAVHLPPPAPPYKGGRRAAPGAGSTA